MRVSWGLYCVIPRLGSNAASLSTWRVAWEELPPLTHPVSAQHLVCHSAHLPLRCVQAYSLQGYVTDSYQRLLHGVNDKNKRTSLIGGLGMGYFQLVMFCMYALVTWFGSLELTSCR